MKPLNSLILQKADILYCIIFRNNLLKLFLFLFIIFFTSMTAYSDVVWLQDGSIYFGAIESADSAGITIKTFGEIKKIAQSEILKSEKTLELLKNQQVDILLKDGSVLKGKIQNYDDEIGVLIHTDLGSTTIPVSSIKNIYDPAKKKIFTGFPFTVGIAGGYYIPVMGLADDFKSNYNLSFFAEYNMDFWRGCSLGGEITTVLIDYKADDSEFSIYTLQPYVIYKFVQLKNSSSFIKNIIPFVSAGIGGAYIIKKTSATEKSEVDTVGNFKIGFDISITDNIGARIYTGMETILQSGSDFNRVFFNAGVLYSF